jgi:hypothetical protein
LDAGGSSTVSSDGSWTVTFNKTHQNILKNKNNHTRKNKFESLGIKLVLPLPVVVFSCPVVLSSSTGSSMACPFFDFLQQRSGDTI